MSNQDECDAASVARLVHIPKFLEDENVCIGKRGDDWVFLRVDPHNRAHIDVKGHTQYAMERLVVNESDRVQLDLLEERGLLVVDEGEEAPPGCKVMKLARPLTEVPSMGILTKEQQ